MSDVWTDRLSDYLDGELDERERRELERHLGECAECEVTLGELRSVAEEARALSDQPPEVDLWPGIAARIGPADRSIARARRGAPWWLGGRLSLSLPQAVAASLVLALLSGGTVWLALGGRPRAAFLAGAGSRSAPVAPMTEGSGRGATARSPVAPLEAGGDRGAASFASAAGADPRYEATIAELNRILESGRNRLDPATVKVLERNLAIIDRAVAEARRAVETDPSNFYLREHLAKTMKRKADLLRLASSIVGAQG